MRPNMLYYNKKEEINQEKKERGLTRPLPRQALRGIPQRTSSPCNN